MDLRKITSEELKQYHKYCLLQGNLQAGVEVADFQEFYEKTVKVVKGRKKDLLGREGKVFWVKRKGYSNNPWTGWVTTIGCRDEEDQVFFVNCDNVEVLQ